MGRMWPLIALGFGVLVLVHTAPAPLLLERMAGDRAVWHMPRSDPPTLYLTYDDGPNPTTTPDLLNVLARENVKATFFLIDRHITEQTAPIVRRMFHEGHAVALHSAARAWILLSAGVVAERLTAAASHIEQVAGTRPCRAFRPHAGWRTGSMYEGVKQIDYTLVGWGWMLWDWNWFREQTAESVTGRILSRARGGDIIVMHDGDEKAPFADQRHTVDATARMIPALRATGFRFGTICDTREGR
jgi:peptidoglycan-N-acetylglucosamine deacetylase